MRHVAPSALLAACLLNLPLVYVLVAAEEGERSLMLPTLLAAVASMATAWAAGALIEGKRAGAARAVAGATVLEPALLWGALGLSGDAGAAVGGVLVYALAGLAAAAALMGLVAAAADARRAGAAAA